MRSLLIFFIYKTQYFGKFLSIREVNLLIFVKKKLGFKEHINLVYWRITIETLIEPLKCKISFKTCKIRTF